MERLELDVTERRLTTNEKKCCDILIYGCLVNKEQSIVNMTIG